MRHLLRRAGFDITRYPAGNSTPRNIAFALADRPVDGAVDVGAHHGQFVRTLRNLVGYQGAVVSFEPMRESFRMLAETHGGDPQWTGHNLAIGSQRGEAILNVYEGTDFNSFYDATAFGSHRFDVLRAERRESVQVERLDDVLDLHGRLLLKTDTQGHDRDVLDSAAGVMDRVDIVVIELSVLPIYEGTPSMVEMIQYLADLGFVSAGLVPVTRAGAKVIEYDGVFVRN